jgi:hypothetical protein
LYWSFAQGGVEHVQVICPGFSVDCLETIQEIDEENRAYFIQAGGKKFSYIPALNDRKDHIEALSNIIAEHLIQLRIIYITLNYTFLKRRVKIRHCHTYTRGGSKISS